MSTLKTIARPYAKAIFEFAKDRNMLKEWKEMLMLFNRIVMHHKIKNFLSGAVSASYLSFVIIFICHNKINRYGENFIKLLAQNKRLNALSNILEYFITLEKIYEKKTTVIVTSSIFLEKSQVSSIHAILEKFLCKKIHVVCTVDPKIISGIIVKIDNTIFDFSVSNSLKQLSSFLKS